MIFISNSLPNTSDNSDGFYRRLIIVPFNKTITNEEIDVNIREISSNHHYEEDKIEFKQEDGLYIEDVTSCFDMEYSNTVDETYSLLKLKHYDFEIESVQKEKTTLDNSKYFYIIKEYRDDVANKESKREKIRSIRDLTFINKKDKSYSVCDPGV